MSCSFQLCTCTNLGRQPAPADTAPTTRLPSPTGSASESVPAGVLLPELDGGMMSRPSTGECSAAEDADVDVEDGAEACGRMARWLLVLVLRVGRWCVSGELLWCLDGCLAA
jgi:hypothetical protein